MDKRGIGMKFLAGVIILVISTGLIVYAWSKINATSNIDKEACLAAIEARSTFNLGLAEIGKEFISLKPCKTEKICISGSGNTCDAAGFKQSRNNPITTVKIGNNPTKPEILNTISNSLYDCHKMLGQGQLNFLPRSLTSKNYCLICSRIVLDEETRQEVGSITYKELYAHMQQRKNKEGVNYLKYVYGKQTANEMLLTLGKVTEAIEEKQGLKINPEDLTINLDYKEGNAVVAQLSPESTWESVVGAGSVGLGLAVIGIVLAIPTGGSSLTLTLVGVGVAGTGVATAAIGDAVTSTTALEDVSIASGPVVITETPDGEAAYGAPTLYTYDADVLRSLNCYSFEVAP